jgi:cyanophycinase
MKTVFVILLLIFCNHCSGQQISNPSLGPEAAQNYIPSQLWSGLLILQNTYTPDAEVRKVLKSWKGSESLAACYITATGSSHLSEFTDLFPMATPPTQIAAEDLFRADENHWLAAISDYRFIWLEVNEAGADAIASLPLAKHLELIAHLKTVLEGGGVVCIAGDLNWVGQRDLHKPGLLHARIVASATGQDSKADLLSLNIPSQGRLVLSQRQAICRSEAPVEFSVPATKFYPNELTYTLRKGEVIDWVQLQRTVDERRQPVFPTATRYDHRLLGGALVIGGGGGMPAEVWQRFVDLAGGEHARIVILPTATPNPTAAPGFEHRLLEKSGAGTVVTLPQTRLEEVSSAEFLQELDRATGVWFGGGRQWHFVDAYWGTPAWNRLREVCKRGGVIGGSSAGATIQGDVLVRGAPAGNHIMLADGYRHGLGLLPGVAIDQHFAQRNRFKDLERCLTDFPTVFGIGIDEQTALVVTAPNHCEVVGNGSVWCFPSRPANASLGAMLTRAESRQEFKSGSNFLLESP